MNAKQISDAIGKLDDEMLAEAAKVRQNAGGQKKRPPQWAGILAACVCLALCFAAWKIGVKAPQTEPGGDKVIEKTVFEGESLEDVMPEDESPADPSAKLDHVPEDEAYDDIFYNDNLDTPWPGEVTETESLRLETTGSIVNIHYGDTEEPDQLYAFCAKVYIVNGGETAQIKPQQKEVWERLCSECGFIPYFPDESNGIPNTELFYFFAELRQVKAMEGRLIGEYAMIVRDLSASPKERTDEGETVHVRIPLKKRSEKED